MTPPSADPPSLPDHRFTVARQRGAVVVTVHGELDLACSTHLGAVLGDLIEGQGNLKVGVDLGHVTRVHPAALGVFAAGAKLARHHGGELSVAGLEDGPSSGAPLPAGAADTHGDEHLVEFYEHDGLLADSVRDHIEPGLRGDDAVVVVATERHRELFEAALTRAGVDLGAARDAERYLDLDAEETLARFMVDGAPDPGRFRTVIGGLIGTATAGGGRVRIYGEMVALLWAEGNVSAAISLEDLWNDLGRCRSFSLLCAYPVSAFDVEGSSGLFRLLCEQHSSAEGGARRP